MDQLNIWQNGEATGWIKSIFDNISYHRCDQPDQADYLLFYQEQISNNHLKNLKWLGLINKFSILHKKPYVTFLHDDPTDPIGDLCDNGILFRTSLYKKTQSGNEYLLPSFNKCTVSSFSPSPVCDISIGFVGAITHMSRVESIQELNKVPDLIKTYFIVRDKFHLHLPEYMQKRNEGQFDAIIKHCPYQLCIRGTGNFSHRFYETMMMGRIPVIIDSDMPLACSDKIGWESHIVIAKSAKELPQALIDYHNTHNIKEEQKWCYDTWINHLSPIGFSKYVNEVLLTKKSIFFTT